MPTESKNVFLSYSHADVLLVSPVVKLLRVNKSFVFQDSDTIEPGKKWRGQIGKALAESHLVVVFWCWHANQSNEVSKEWRAAIEQKKDLLPVLLDPTPLPQELAEFQWIDFRGTVGPNHNSIGLAGPPIKASLPRPARSLLLMASAACAAVLVIAAILAWFYLPNTARHPKSSFPVKSSALFPWESPAPWSLPPFPLKSPAPWSLPPLESPAAPPLQMEPPRRVHLPFPGIVLTLIICLIYLWKATRKLALPIGSLGRRPGDIERHIASEVEAEILRRTILRRESGK